ncbi:MAG: tetratricopeptide repeat protein [Acidobacteriota bacterium]
MLRPPRLPSLCVHVLLVGLVVGLVASPAFAGRLIGEVVDENGEPLEGVRVTATSDGFTSFHEVDTTNKRGGFMFNFQRAQYIYKLLFEKPGYQSFTQEIQPKQRENVHETFPMEKAAAQLQEARGDLAADVIGSSNEAVTAFNAGLSAQRDGDAEAARGHFEAALAADPSLAPAHIGLAQVASDLDDYETAAASAARALELQPSDREALRVRYEALRALGQDAEADAVSAELEAAEGSAEMARRVYNEGGEAFQAGDRDTARAKFEEAASLDPTLYDAQHAVASLRLAQGDVEPAIEAAKQALTLKPDAVPTLRILYDAYEAQGNLEELTSIAPRLAKVDPEFGAAKLLEQGTELFNAGQTDTALLLLEQALAIESELAKAHYMLGVLKVSTDAEAAKSHFTTFLALAPDDADAATAKEMLSYLQ